MGRYYHGDIEGKFWFAVQSSNDADFFGCEGEARFLNVPHDNSNLENEPRPRIQKSQHH
jgi:hypothetical protein